MPGIFILIICKLLAFLFKSGMVMLLLALLLFGGRLQSSLGFVGSLFREFNAILQDPETQWMVVLCLGVYFTLFLILRVQAKAPNNTADCRQTFLLHDVSVFWLAGALLVSAAIYWLRYVSCTHAVVLLAGVVIGQGMALLCLRKQHRHASIVSASWILALIVLLVALASIWKLGATISYTYHKQARWTGPWDNPNIFGLLMGTGVALAAGLGLAGLRIEAGRSQMASKNCKLEFGKYLGIVLCLFAVALLSRGLYHSFSRGAWLATLCGMGWLALQWIRTQGLKSKQQLETATRSTAIAYRSLIKWLARNWIPLSIVLLSVVVLDCWHFRHSKSEAVAGRIASVANENDFSWRNRVDAWEGALQITAEHPLLGAGWNQPEPLYELYYLPPKLADGAAIEMNDYLMLCATLGIPALFCFGMYLWLSLVGKAESRKRKTEMNEMDWAWTTCRAGAVVLAIGFWFDGGLFKLATASVFWILLELGNVETTNEHEFTPMEKT